jgi:serine/threonine protein kinase
MASISCPACNHENEGTALFCHGCGRPLAEGEAAGDLIGKEILGTYQLTDLLGQGGMSVVYRARHMLTDQEVAVKLLPPELSNQREVKARFIEEARTLARLEHPNIVTLHNLVESEGYLYLVMQCAEGETFDNIIAQEGRVELGESVRIIIEVLRALEYAHDQGVIHRDIKPSNIIIRGDGTVKVMDFGIAKIMGSTKLTQTGQTMGTVRYMSPEQVRGKAVDHRSDLYSLGVTLYEALTGRTPFDGENHFEIMQKHLQEPPPPPSKLVPMPQELEEVILRSMGKLVDQRYQSAREFRHALQRVPVQWDARRGTGSMQVPEVTAEMERDLARSKRRPVRVWPIVLAVVLLLASGGGVFWALRESNDPVHAAGSGKGTAKGTGSGSGTAAPPIAWPKPHPAATKIAWKAERKYGLPALLQVFSQKERDLDQLRDQYVKARDAYNRFLRDEGMSLEVKVRPLNLCVVSEDVFKNGEKYWNEKAGSPFYQATLRTLWVSDSERSLQSDLTVGMALHFCALFAELSDKRCVDLAEAFEVYLRKQK